MIVRRIAAADLEACVERLAEILIDAVDAGAGVSFLKPLARAAALAYWRGLHAAIAEGRIILLMAEDAGTVQLHRVWPPNQPHRGEIAKLLVHRDRRGQGIGAALMAVAEAEARALGLTLLNFDTVAGSPADRFYRRLGYRCAGIIPGYALSPAGAPEDTAIFYKHLGGKPAVSA